MKKQKLLILSILSLTVNGCVDINVINSENNESIKDSISINHEVESTDTSIISQNSEKESIETSTSKNESTSSQEEKGPVVLDFYSINDFHGRIYENVMEAIPGISKLATYLDTLKAKNEDGYVFLNNGDLWQDTYESYYSKGKLLTECMEEMDCETMTLGNHEFDWGVNQIYENQNYATSCDFLCANLYEYPDDSVKSDLAKEYKIIERKGLKIGIIGTIGSTQNTSITSSIWKNLTFKNTTEIIKNLSDTLRNDKGCDIIVLENHADYSGTDAEEITKVSPKSNKKYVDAVFNGHSHQTEKYITNGVAFVQAGSHGQKVGHISLVYDNGNVTTKSYECDLGEYKINTYESSDKIDAIIDKYMDSNYYNSINKNIGTINSESSYINKATSGSLLAKITYETYSDIMKKYNVDIVMNNGTRSSLTAGDVTYEDIFNAFPFTNHTIIAKNIKGKDINNELNYNFGYTNNIDTFEDDKYYTVAVIDYLLYHKNTSREYDYFPSLKDENILYEIETYSVDIIANYLKNVGTISLN